jgi:phage tail protein X
MSEQPGHTVPPRDVPPPRPVGAAGGPVEGEVVGTSGLGAAARSLADAVSGLLGRDGGSSGPGRARGAASVLSDLAGTLGQAARSARPGPGGGARRTAGGDRLGDLLHAAAPRLPVRDRERLRRAHPGATDDEIAEALAARAARLTGAVGAATGGLAAAQRFLPSALIAVPIELAAQTLLVGAVEVVLVGELHELAGRPAAGDQRARAAGYVSSWQARRAAGGAGTRGLAAVLGAAGASALRRQANRRLARGRSATAPMVLGASLTARANSKETVALARELWAELRGAPPR